MRLTSVPFKKMLNKAYQKVKPTRPEIELFKAKIIWLLDRIDHKESEENVKNHLQDFSKRQSFVVDTSALAAAMDRLVYGMYGLGVKVKII